jgi:hypothetical protein
MKKAKRAKKKKRQTVRMSDHYKLLLIEGVLDDMDKHEVEKIDAIQALVDEDMEHYERLMC